jgi:hypothetical protein
MLILKRFDWPWASNCVEETPLSRRGRSWEVVPKLANAGVEKMLATSAPKRIELTFMITTPVVGYMVILAVVFEMKLNLKIKLIKNATFW